MQYSISLFKPVYQIENIMIVAWLLIRDYLTVKSDNYKCPGINYPFGNFKEFQSRDFSLGIYQKTRKKFPIPLTS